MFQTKSELEFCMVCGNPNPPDRAICECGGRNFVFGNDFTYENKKVVCNCGNIEFRMSTHMDFAKFANTTYICTKCGNPMATQIARRDGWMDD
jgi:hypothetical protein